MTVQRVMAKIGAAAHEPAGERRMAEVEYLRKWRLPVDQRGALAPERVAIHERASMGLRVRRRLGHSDRHRPAMSAPTRTTVLPRTMPLRKASKCVGKSAKSMVTTLACTRVGRHSLASRSHNFWRSGIGHSELLTPSS